MKKKIKKQEKPKTIKELAESFVESDGIPATAGKFLLMTLALGGIVFAGALAPGLLLASKEFSKSKKYNKKQIQNAVYNLKRRKLIEVVQMDDGKIKVKLTNKGRERIKEFSFETLKIQKPIRWDKKWRILIFDIPTKPKIYNQARNALRSKIKELGFYQMQKSVWVYPYECEDEILLIAEIYQVQKHIEIITAEKILHENIVRKVFKL
ncbi:MAG: hypothetical protein PHW24_00715 [Candidatus Moranbacteria bacterium]|nr:hypothetical protein [Candidatus Moranbacteria bacterium]